MPAGDWRDNGIVLRAGATAKDSVILKYGDFLGAILDFFIIALVLYLLVSKLVKAAEGRLIKSSDPPAVKECPLCMETIPYAAKRCKFCTSDLAPAARTV
jgi:large conductance mechanosensitive channel